MAMKSCLLGHIEATKASKQRAKRAIDPVHQIARPASARDAVMEVAKSTQKGQVVLTPGHDRLEVVAAGDCGAGHQEQHLLEWLGHPPTLTIIVDLGEMLQQQRQTGRRKHRF
jgi:hypothetical protein